MNANLIQSAERAVIIRALVAAGLIAAMVVALSMSAAYAQPGCDRYAVDGSCLPKSVSNVARVAVGASRPAGCPKLWCGCYARKQVGLPKEFNRALHWLTLRRVSKRVGAWAVMRRRGGGHVGRVVAIDPNGNPILLSGNHNGRVGIATYPASRIIAYVVP